MAQNLSSEMQRLVHDLRNTPQRIEDKLTLGPQRRELGAWASSEYRKYKREFTGSRKSRPRSSSSQRRKAARSR